MQVHKNSFEAGLNTNVAKNLIPANKYVEANNVNIAGINNFFALENIKGTAGMESFMTNAVGTGVAGVFANRYKVGDIEDVDGLTIFTYSATTFTIWCYAGTLYKMYEEAVDNTYSESKPIVHAVSYPESGRDILYFTDNYHELRKVRCEIPTAATLAPSTAFLDEIEIKLLQHGANGTVTVTDVEAGGSLFCGSYQFAYQLVNPTKKLYTKFSMFSNPIHVYLDNSTLDAKSGVGLQSDSQIELSITPSPEELGATLVSAVADQTYTHFRLAVLENIEPSGVNVETVWLTKLEEINDYRTQTIPSVLYSDTLTQIKYATNTRLESLSLSDIVVDKLAVETVKTIAIRENRLVGGNITYKDLSLDNGTPAITSGSILKATGGVTNDNFFTDAELASKYRGYFRDEVYRFAISYFDGDGNFSYPSVLDLSTITHNQITGAYKDMKFPSRDQSLDGTTYTLFNSGGGVQSLGLQLVGLNNHPTWAHGFVILRAERIKNIIFQTPIIPMAEVNSIGAVEKYPYESLEISGATTKVVTNAEVDPMGPFTSHFPRNYFHLPNRKIVKNTSHSGTTTNVKFEGEVFYSDTNVYRSGMVFPPAFMYEDQPFVFNPNFKLETIDAALVKGKYSNFTDAGSGSASLGLNIRTSLSATFYAVTDSQYYYDSAHTGTKTSIASSKDLTAFEPFNNFNSGTVVGGLQLFNHDKFETSGMRWGALGATQKTGVVAFDSAPVEINNNSSLVFTAGSQISHTSSDFVFYTTDNTLVHTIEIANMVANLTDTRYGSYDTPHNFISTGTVKVFSSGERNQVAAGTSTPITVDVWGGDCYTVPHLFKITDTVYGVTNPNKYLTAPAGEASSLVSVQNWERAFNDDSANACSVSIPVPFKNAAQFIQIVLESEYNPSIMDTEIVSMITSDGVLPAKVPIFGIAATASEAACRVPLTYKLNQNHKKANSDKIFQIKDPLLTEVTNLGARFIYSDQKVYQTSINGFDGFRVLNFKDLSETYGDITRLEVLGDHLYAIQEHAVSYIGIGERTLETTDALTLAVQSGNFLGNIITIKTNVGSQHIGSVVNTGNAIYFIDNERQSINRLSARTVDNISEEALFSSLRNGLEGQRFNNELLAIHDPIFKQVWFVHTGMGGATPFCYVFDEARSIWVANYQFVQGGLQGGAYSGGALYLTGVNEVSNNLTLEQMYEGTRTELFGTVVQPSVKFVVNPHTEIGKTFDDVLVLANDRLEEIDFTVVRESSLGNQTASGIILDVTTRGEGNYRAKILRDSAGARLRGTMATAELKWKTGSVGQVAVAVPSVLTKYRVSENKF